MLFRSAANLGLKGVYSSAVTGHPYTQEANLKLGCIETGLELSYIPSNLKSIIKREGENQRQAVMSFFKPTGAQSSMDVYVPEHHRGMIEDTYKHLGLQRNLLTTPSSTLADESSELEEIAKTEWNQMYINIINAGYDLRERIRRDRKSVV